MNSAILSASAKLISKLLGVISTVILARLLAPEAFGYIAVVSIALYFFDILSHVASEQYIIQKKRVSYAELNTAWTANFVLKVFICLIIIILSPWIAAFFERPELTDAFRASSLILPIQSLKTPAYILLKRQLKFSVLFWTSLIERLFAVPLVVTLAYFLKNYWAFIITDIAANILAVLLSYAFVKKRPRLSMQAIANQWHFSKWMMGKSIVGYMRSQCDTVVVSKFFSASLLGNFHMARELAMMPAHFLLGPAIEPLLSAFKNDKENEKDLLNNIAFTLIVVVLVAIPICVFIWQYSPQIVRVLLGQGWGAASELLPVLILLFLYWTMMQVAETALVAQAKVRLVFYIDCCSLTVILIGLVLAIRFSESLVLIAWTRAILGIMTCFIVLLLVFKNNLKNLLQIALFAISAIVASLLWQYTLELFEPVNLFSDRTNFLYTLLALGTSSFYLVFIMTILVLTLSLVAKNYHARRLQKICVQAVFRR